MRNKNGVIFATFSLWVSAISALADGAAPARSPTPAPAEARLINLYDQAKEKAQKDAATKTETAKFLAIEFGNAGSPAPSPTTAAKPVKGSDIIRELAEEVDRLQSKVAVTSSTILSTQKPKAAKRIGSKVTYNYKEGDLYEVHTGVDRITDVELQPGEQLTNPPVSGDTVRWKIGIVKSSSGQKEVSHIVIKPLDTDIETNILITTNRHVYHLRAVSNDWYMPAVSWNYPQEEDPSFAAMARRKKSEEQVVVSPDSLSFDYTIDGDGYSWKPVRAFDDGQKTYIQMPESLRAGEAPALFVVEDGNAMLVNYRVKGSYYIVDRLFERAELRVGPKKRVEIRNEPPHRSFWERLFND